MIVSVLHMKEPVLVARVAGFSAPSITNVLRPNTLTGSNKHALYTTGNTGWKIPTARQMSGFLSISCLALGSNNGIESYVYAELTDLSVWAFYTYCYLNPPIIPAGLFAFTTNLPINRIRMTVSCGTTSVVYILSF